MRRILLWFLTLALTGGGVLVAHDLAYRMAGAGSEGVHAYLTHAPQLVAVLATLTLGALAFTSRCSTLPAWPFPALALSGFAVQEHAERLLHTGELPLLATQPVFVIGTALQVPIALAAWLLARRLLRAVTAPTPRRRPPRTAHLLLLPSLRPYAQPAGRAAVTEAARGPPTVQPAR